MDGWQFRGEVAFDEALDRLTVMADLAGRRAVVVAAALVQRRTQERLKETSRSRDEVSPAAPGDPPATVTGNLANSMKIDGPIPNGFGSYLAATGPTARYSRVQELGATLFARGGRMKFRYGGVFYNVTSVVIPARPSLRPSLDEARDDGSLYAVYRHAWRDAQTAALAE